MDNELLFPLLLTIFQACWHVIPGFPFPCHQVAMLLHCVQSAGLDNPPLVGATVAFPVPAVGLTVTGPVAFPAPVDGVTGLDAPT